VEERKKKEEGRMKKTDFFGRLLFRISKLPKLL
jgi:hypothetical protein